ncbi:retrovirus-related pol polyprotein from transposon TNT 1-94 [Tanacetum coccineum]
MVSLNVALCMFTRRIVIQRQVEDLQLGVESYQKKLNLTKPDTSSDGTLDDVRSALNDIAKGIRMEYMPMRNWSNLDKKRARVMVQDIDKQLYQRRLMQNLEKFITKSLTTNVETSNNEIPSHEGEVFHEISESFQEESSSSSLNDDVQQTSEEVMVSLTNTQSTSNNMVPSVNEAKGIDYDETFAPVARIEAIRLFLAYAAHKDFTYPDHVYGLDKALYGLKQAPQAWYDILSKFLIDSGFQKGSIDATLFIKKKDKHIMLIQIYVDDIIFGSTNPKYCTKFSKLMVKRFEMSMMGEINFFLGLQVNQFSNGIFINQSKYTLDILKQFGMENCDTVPTPMVEQAKLKLDLVGKPVDHTDYRSMIGSLMYLISSRLDIMFATCLWYPKDSGFDLTAYSDVDHAGCHLDQKTESEYVAVSGCCAQVLWMRTQLTDYGFFYRKDHVEKGTIELYFIGTEFQLADLFTKSLPEARFKFLVEKLEDFFKSRYSHLFSSKKKASKKRRALGRRSFKGGGM